MRKFVTTVLLLCAINAPAFASIQFLNAPLAPLYVADTVLWDQLGASTPLGQTFTASGINFLAVNGAFSNIIGGTTCEVLGLNCYWPQTAGFSVNESLIWAEDLSGFGSGPLTLTFLPQFGAGAYIQSAGDLQFTAKLQAFNGNSSLGSGIVASNGQGDPLYLGVIDSTADITGLQFSLTACGSTSGVCNPTDFAIGSLTAFSATPEPSSLLLALTGLAAFGFARAKQRQ